MYGVVRHARSACVMMRVSLHPQTFHQCLELATFCPTVCPCLTRMFRIRQFYCRKTNTISAERERFKKVERLKIETPKENDQWKASSWYRSARLGNREASPGGIRGEAPVEIRRGACFNLKCCCRWFALRTVAVQKRRAASAVSAKY